MAFAETAAADLQRIFLALHSLALRVQPSSAENEILENQVIQHQCETMLKEL